MSEIQAHEIRWITSHVERLLQEEWEACRVVADDDGDYMFRSGTAACWVSVMDTAPIMVRVFAHAATGIKPTLKLFRELNDIQRRALSASVLWTGGTVVVSQTLSPVGLTRPVLAQAMTAVAGVADDIGLLLAGMFGGSTPFPVEAHADERSADPPT